MVTEFPKLSEIAPFYNLIFNIINSAQVLMWSIYMIRCGDNSLYTGISNNVPQRFAVHQSGKAQAAKYTKNRHPLKLVFAAEIGSRAAASRVEYRVKQLSKYQKECLVAGTTSLSGLNLIKVKN